MCHGIDARRVGYYPAEAKPVSITPGTCMALSDRNRVHAHVYSLCAILQKHGEPKPPCLLTYAAATMLSVLKSM